MQYKVPQNVDIEDRVIGPLSLRQFMIILIGGAVILMLNFVLVGFLRPLFWLMAIILGVGSFGIALAKYGSQNFEDFLASAMNTLSRPRQRVWGKYEDNTQVVKKEIKPIVKKSTPKKTLLEAHDDLSRLAELVDSGGNIPMSAKDRIIPFGTHGVDETTPPDLLQPAITEHASLDAFLEAALKKAPKREPLISESAKISPDKEFHYDKVELADSQISHF